MNDETRAVLREAKGLVAKAWFSCKPDGYFSTRTGNDTSNCVLTAIYWDGWRPGCAEAVREFEKALGVESSTEVAEWNNAQERTQAEVVAMFDRILTGDTPTPDPDPEDVRETVVAV